MERDFKGSRYDGNLSTSDICKKIKEYGAKQFPKCKFSVSKDGYNSIVIALVSGDFDAFQKGHESESRQFNHYHPDGNTQFTEKCINVLKKMSEYAESYNYDHSDITTDYFCVNFFLNVKVGKYNKCYVNTKTAAAEIKMPKTKTEKRIQHAVGSGNWVYKTTVAGKEDYYLCERGDNPYAHYYTQYSILKKRMESMTEAGLSVECHKHAIKVNYWNKIEERIENERSEMKEKTFVKTEVKETPKHGNIEIIDYSEKAIAVVGDTKPIKNELKAAGGAFNKRLSCGCGWVFSKRKLEVVKALVAGK